jgi:hypothetical protein
VDFNLVRAARAESLDQKLCPDLAESEKGENITAVERISADGWLMAPFFIFKASGANHMEVWYDGSEVLPSDTTTAISPKVGYLTNWRLLG